MTDTVDITTSDSQSPNATFLFTSESVGEGHPGEMLKTLLSPSFLFRHNIVFSIFANEINFLTMFR